MGLKSGNLCVRNYNENNIYCDQMAMFSKRIDTATTGTNFTYTEHPFFVIKKCSIAETCDAELFVRGCLFDVLQRGH